MADDFLSELIRQVLAASPQGPDAVQKVETTIRQQWGGSRVYVQKKPTEVKVQRLAAAVAAGAPLQTAFDAAGIGRRRGFQLLNRPWRVR